MENHFSQDIPITGLARARFPLSDLEKTRTFYRDVIGFKDVSYLKDATGKIAGVGFKVNDEQCLEFATAPPTTPVLVTFGATDVGKLRRMLEQRGMAPSPIAMDTNGSLCFTLEGLDHHLEFVQPAAGSSQSKAPAARAGQVSDHLFHISMTVADLNDAVAFCTENLGFREIWRGPSATDLRAVIGGLPGPREDCLELMGRHAAPQHICLAARDIQDVYKTFVKRGADPGHRPGVSANGHWVLNVMDPNEIRVEFMEPNPAKQVEPAAASDKIGRLQLVVPGVWFRRGEMEMSHSNNVVIEMNDYLIVVDANYPSGAQAVIDDAKKVSAKPIKYVINTHGDPDHVYGNPVFTRMGAITLAHVSAIADMNRNEPEGWRRVLGWRKDVVELNLPGPEPPQQTFSENSYVISDSSRRVELHHLPWGHTRSDIFVYLPKEKVLCTGDVVVSGPYSDPNRAYLGNWANEIRVALQFDVEHVLPGHGGPAGKELLERQIQFFEELYKAVQAAVDEGKTLDQIVTMTNDRAVATTIRLSKSMQDAFVFPDIPGLKFWQISRFPTQVKNTYMEISQGKPYGEIAGGE